jgi:hypothetical protein
MLERAALLTASLTLFACGGLVVFDPDEGEGDGGASSSPGPGPGPETSSSSSSASMGGSTSGHEAYCIAVDQAETDPECIDGLDIEACMAAEECATNILRPDTGPPLLECLGKHGCQGVPFECVLALLEFGLTPFGQAFFDECIESGPCFEIYCHQAYWLTDEALATSMGCFIGLGCGPLDNCYEDTALWQCNGWLRKVNSWYF